VALLPLLILLILTLFVELALLTLHVLALLVERAAFVGHAPLIC